MRHDLVYSVTALADLEAILLHVAGDAAIRSTLSQPHDCGSFMKKPCKL